MKLAALPRLGDAVFIFILAAGLLVGQKMLNLDSDLGRHLALGRYMLDTGDIPRRDILSFTRAGEERPPYEWLSQVTFSLAERALGLDGVVLLTAGVIAAAFLVVFMDARERGGGALVALGLTVWAAAASSLHWLTRPHVFSFFFLAIWLLLLDRLRRGDGRTVWQLPMVMLIWANLHGGFVFGFFAWFAYLLGWIVQSRQHTPEGGSGRQLLIVGATSLLASLLTPSLGGNWSAVLANSSRYVLARTAETSPVALATPSSWPFIGLIASGIFLGLRRGRRQVVAHGVLLFITAALGLGIMRNIPLFCLAAVPVLAAWQREESSLESSFRRLEARASSVDLALRGFPWSILVLPVCAAFLAGHGISTNRGLYEFDSQRFPVKAVDWMVGHEMRGATFNDLNWGGYLLYRMWPGTRVFIDSQSDFYGEQFIREYEDTYQATGDWQNDLDRRGITYAILPPNAALAVRLMGDARWTVGYRDSSAVVFLR